MADEPTSTLTDVELEMLAMERLWWQFAGAKEQAIRERFVARWMPRPGSPFELRGGSSDGETITIREDEHGYPERGLRMAPAERWDGNGFDSLTDYTLVGFRNDVARWVYEVQRRIRAHVGRASLSATSASKTRRPRIRRDSGAFSKWAILGLNQ